jgi:hypothetical protein
MDFFGAAMLQLGNAVGRSRGTAKQQKRIELALVRVHRAGAASTLTPRGSSANCERRMQRAHGGLGLNHEIDHCTPNIRDETERRTLARWLSMVTARGIRR